MSPVCTISVHFSICLLLVRPLHHSLLIQTKNEDSVTEKSYVSESRIWFEMNAPKHLLTLSTLPRVELSPADKAESHECSKSVWIIHKVTCVQSKNNTSNREIIRISFSSYFEGSRPHRTGNLSLIQDNSFFKSDSTTGQLILIPVEALWYVLKSRKSLVKAMPRFSASITFQLVTAARSLHWPAGSRESVYFWRVFSKSSIVGNGLKTTLGVKSKTMWNANYRDNSSKSQRHNYLATITAYLKPHQFHEQWKTW